MDIAKEIFEDVFDSGLHEIGNMLDKYGEVRFYQSHLSLKIPVNQDDCLDDIEMLCGKNAATLVSEKLEDCDEIVFFVEIGYGFITKGSESKLAMVAFCYVDDDIRYPLYKFEQYAIIKERMHATSDLEICSVISESVDISSEDAEDIIREFFASLKKPHLLQCR